MVKLLPTLMLGFTLALVGCGGGTPTAEEVRDAITDKCGLVVKVADISAVIAAAANPGAGIVVSGLSAITKMVCSQFEAKRAMSTLTSDPCVAVVNGVCIHREGE